MDVFTSFTQNAIDCENNVELEKCFNFIDHEIGNVTSEVENSIILSYLGKLNFSRDPGAKKRLSGRLRKIIDELERYHNSPSKNSGVNSFLKKL